MGKWVVYRMANPHCHVCQNPIEFPLSKDQWYQWDYFNGKKWENLPTEKRLNLQPNVMLVPLSVIFSKFFYIVFQVSAYRMLAIQIRKYRITL